MKNQSIRFSVKNQKVKSLSETFENKINQKLINFTMEQNFITKNRVDMELNLQERQAVESLLQIQKEKEEYDRRFDWNLNIKEAKKSKKYLQPFNFIQTGKKTNPQNLEMSNFIFKEKLHNIHKVKRARSLFDPLKIFKFTSKDVQQKESYQNFRINKQQGQKQIIQKHPGEMRDLNFKTGHPSKNIFSRKDQTNFNDKNNSYELIDGQTVMIQVQSYEQNFNKREIEYFMSKTLGPRNFRSHLSLQKKQEPLIASVIDMKTFNTKLFKQPGDTNKKNLRNEGRVSPKMRFTAYVNKKSSQDKISKSTDQNSSLDLGSIQRNQDIAQSLKLLLNNLKNKKIIDTKEKTKISYHSNSNFNQSPVNKIFDKEGIFKQYEEEQFKALKRVRMNHPNCRNDNESKRLQLVKNLRNESPRSYRKYSKETFNQSNNDMIKVSSPTRKYYQKNTKKDIDEKQLRIFQIKKIG